MALINPNETTRVEISDGAWVDMRTRLGVGDQKRIKFAAVLAINSMNATVQGTGEGATIAIGEGSRFDPDVLAYAEFAALDIGIVAWSFDEPVTPENIRLLDEEDFDTIKAATNTLWGKSRSDDERKNSSASTPSTSRAKPPARRSSSGRR
jgi:hypothetical protein